MLVHSSQEVFEVLDKPPKKANSFTQRQVENLDSSSYKQPSEQVILCTYDQAKDCATLLEDLMPKNVILYDPDVSFIRQLEVYNAQQSKDNSLCVYFMVYEESAEQQAYLTEVKREKVFCIFTTFFNLFSSLSLMNCISVYSGCLR